MSDMMATLRERIAGLAGHAQEEILSVAASGPADIMEGIPDDLPAWRLGEVLRLRKQLHDGTFEREGARWWVSTGLPVPTTCFQDAFLPAPAAQERIERRENDKAIAAYRRAQAQARPTPDQQAERAFEVRAAFGPGERVVDIITGERGLA